MGQNGNDFLRLPMTKKKLKKRDWKLDELVN